MRLRTTQNAPFKFLFVGPTNRVTAAEIVIDSDGILDGEGNWTVGGHSDDTVFFVSPEVSAETRALAVTSRMDAIIFTPPPVCRSRTPSYRRTDIHP
jgi:hypothetical protein